MKVTPDMKNIDTIKEMVQAVALNLRLSLKERISQLIKWRRELHGNDEAQDYINEQLTKLYQYKYEVLQQAAQIYGNMRRRGYNV